MKFTHKTHWLHQFSFSESRLCRDHDGPDALTGVPSKVSSLETRRSHEQQRPHWDKIEKALTRAVRKKGNPKLKELWESQELREWVMAQVKQNPIDGRLTWMPPNARGHAQQHERLIEKSQNRFAEINEGVSRQVDAYVAVMEAGIEAITEARDLDTGTSLPAGVDAYALIGYLKKMLDKETMKGRQHALVALAKDILNATAVEPLKIQLNATRNLHKDLLGTELYDKVATEVIDKIPDAGDRPHFEDKKKDALDRLLALGVMDFDPADRKAIGDTIDVLETAIADHTAEQDKIVDKLFEHHTRYLRSLSGDDRPALIRTGIRTDYRFDTDVFFQNVELAVQRPLETAEKSVLQTALEARNTSVDAEKAEELKTKYNLQPADTEKLLRILLTKGGTDFDDPAFGQKALVDKAKAHVGAGFDLEKLKRDVVAAWDISVLDEYLDKKLNIHDNVGMSLKVLMLRAKMPSDTAEFLINSEAKIRIADLTDISAIEKLTEPGARFTDTDREAIFADILTKADDMQEDPAEVARTLRALVVTYKATKAASDGDNIEAYINTGFQLTPDRRRDALHILRTKSTADIEVSMFTRLAGEMITRADQPKLQRLVTDYRVAGPATKTARKTALIDFLNDKLKNFPRVNTQALSFVTDTFGRTEETELLNFLTQGSRIVDADKSAELSDALNAYQAAIGTADEPARRGELEALLDVYLDGAELEAAKTKLDTQNNFSEGAAREIYKMLVERNNAGQELFDRDRFVETMAFFYVQDPSRTSEKGALEVATAVAEDLWVDLLDRGLITDKGQVIADSRDKIIGRIQRFYRVGNKSIAMHKAMHEEKLYELTWTDNSKRYFGEFVDFAVEKTGGWFGYVKTLGALVYSKADAPLKKIIKERDRLNAIRTALTNALTTVDESNKMLEVAVQKLKDMKDDTEKLSKPLDPTASTADSVEQALYLLEANAHVIAVLRSENLWDNLPNPIRQVSLWIAMNKGGGDPAAGLLEAKRFLRAYHAAPRAMGLYEEAYERYFSGGPVTEIDRDAYLDALATYQGASDIDKALYDAYALAIQTYHEALALVPETLKKRGAPVQAFTMAGATVEGTVVDIDPTKKDPLAKEAIAVTIKPTKGGANVDAWFKFDEYKAGLITDAKKRHSAASAVYRNAMNDYEASKDPRDPSSTAQNQFLLSYINGGVPNLDPLTHDEKTDLLRYRRKIETVTEIVGRSNLDPMFHRHGLYIKPAAIEALAASRTNPEVGNVVLPEVSLTNGTFSVDNWLQGGHREFADEPLRIILGGPEDARDALIKAYIEKRDVQYDSTDDEGKPAKKVITAEDAFIYVSEIKRVLQWKSEGLHDSYEILEDEEALVSPLDRGFDAMLETLRTMWESDKPGDKIKLGVAIVAAVWLAREVWKRGSAEGASPLMKLAKYSMVGVPLLMFANSAYKIQTGRDILGEQLLYRSPSQQKNILVQWQRRSAKYSPERYGILKHPSGFAAMQELMRRDDPVLIEELHNWRMTVKDDGSGYNNYLNGKPHNLDLTEIQFHLGPGATEQEAAKVAFMTYEALCTDVAAMHNKTSGSVRERANWASDYIYREYYLAESYKDNPALQAKIRSRKVGMLKVMTEEAKLPSLNNKVKYDQTTVEKIASFMGWAPEKVWNKMVQGYTRLEILAMKTGEVLPEYWDGAKELAFKSKDEVVAWLKVRKIMGTKVLVDNYWEAFRALKGLGIVMTETAPKVIKFGVLGSIDISASVIKKIKDTHDYLVKLPPELHYVEAFEEFVLDTFGFDVIEELSLDEARKQIEVEMIAESSFWNGGNYPIRDVKRRVSKSTVTRVTRSDKLIIHDAADEPLSTDAVRQKIEDHIRDLSVDIFGIRIADTETVESKLTPAQQRFLLEIVRASMIQVVGLDTTIKTKIEDYNRAIADLEKKVDDLAQLAVDAAEQHRETQTKLRDATPAYHLAWEASKATVEGEYNRRFAELERFESEHEAAVKEKARLIADKDAKVAAGTLGSIEKVRLDFLINAQENKINAALDKIDETDTRLKELVVRLRLAGLPAGGRNPTAARGITFSDADAKRVLLPPDRSDATAVADVKARLDVFLQRAIAEHADYKALEAQETLDRENKDRIAQEHAQALLDLKAKQAEGVDPVIIQEDALFAALDRQALNAPKADRKRPLLTQVFAEPYNVAEVVPFEWLFGDARKQAEKVATAWKNHRMDNDSTLEAFIKQGKDAEAVASYERYLEHVALSEIFFRGMMQSADGGKNEAQSPLHLSLSEARNDEFYKERQRLISFAQFLEVWEATDPADRPTYLP